MLQFFKTCCFEKFECSERSSASSSSVTTPSSCEAGHLLLIQLYKPEYLLLCQDTSEASLQFEEYIWDNTKQNIIYKNQIRFIKTDEQSHILSAFVLYFCMTSNFCIEVPFIRVKFPPLIYSQLIASLIRLNYGDSSHYFKYIIIIY